MTEDAFADWRDEIAWLARNQPDVDGLAFDRTVLAEASRVRATGSAP